MPTYDYRREDGSVFEFRQGINDQPLTTCPETGQKVTRMISGGAGVVYKGDGWYVTDYKNGSTPSSGTNDTDSTGQKESGTSASDDSSST
jgi:putative FmdB family regulatory protein